MLSRLVLPLGLCALALSLHASGRPYVLDTLRIVTYNIHHGEGTDGRIDLPRLGEIISSLDPDLVALQEVDQATERSDRVPQLTELARLTGMHAVFGKAIDFQGGEYGVGVLSRRPILGASNHRLPGTSDREARTALTVQVALGWEQDVVQFTSTHLDQGREVGNRLAQAGFINQVITPRDGSLAILAGDMNSRTDTDVMQLFGQRWADVFKDPLPDPTARPRFRIDHVLARPAANWRTVESRQIDDLVASDHRPVLVVLERLADD